MATKKTTKKPSVKRRPTRRHKKNPNKYLYLTMGLMALAIVIGASLLSHFGKVDPKDSSKPVDESHTQNDNNNSDNNSNNDNNSQVTSDIVDNSGWETNESGDKIYIGLDGNKVVGVKNIDGETYVFDDDGVMKKDCWAEVGGDYYYLTSDGTAKTGWFESDGYNYYFFDDGAMATGLVEIGDKSYFFQDNGVMKTGDFVTVNKDTYYINGDGSFHYGWLEHGGNKYYFESDGKMAIGQTEINGKNHFFSSKGVEFIVANPWNAVCDENQDYQVELVKLPGGYGHDTKGLIDKNIYDDLMQMMDDCYNTTKHDVYVVSGYRTYAYQERNFRNEVNSHMKGSVSREEAEKLAAEWVAPPGTSEHHLGLAVDIICTCNGSLSEIQDTLPGQQWLMENSWKYGFILRYPEDTKDETGINYEPWHYRYIGKEIAEEIHNMSVQAGKPVTLEGYIKSLG